MANQPKKYKKFVATAATATLVASAIVPVASAASLSDIAGNTHEAAITSLVDAKIISGYADGTFKPNKTLTRSDVVKLLGKYLVTEGYEIPSDAVSSPRFSDLSSSSNKELLEYAAVVADAGVFAGSNGKLLAGDPITRENMAIVLVRMVNTLKDVSLEEYVDGQDFTKEVKDLNAAKAEARSAINVLDFYDITTATNFLPKNTVTRGQFATFLNNVIKSDFSGASATTGTVTAINNTTVEVAFGENIDNIEALNFTIDGLEVTNAVVKQTNKKVAVLTTASQEAGKEYTVSVNSNKIGKFTGISAVIPTAITTTTTSLQGVIGEQVTVKAQVTVAEGQSKAGIPVTFNVVNDKSTNDKIEAESVTNAEGVATYTYTRYYASEDTVTAYATKKSSVYDQAKVYWANKVQLTVSEITTGNELANETKKSYKVTGKANATYYVAIKENLGVTPDKIAQVKVQNHGTQNFVTPYELTTGGTQFATVTTNSNGEGTFTVYGSNLSATPIVYAPESTDAGTNATATEKIKYSKLDLQAQAPTVKFSQIDSLAVSVVAEGNADSANYASTPGAYDQVSVGGRTYTATVTDKAGKIAPEGTVAYVTFEKGNISEVANTVYFSTGTNNFQAVGVDTVLPIVVGKEGKAQFRVAGTGSTTFVKPTVFLNTAGVVSPAKLDKADVQTVAEVTYFKSPVVTNATLKVTDQYGRTVTSLNAGQDAYFTYQSVDQNGFAYRPGSYTVTPGSTTIIYVQVIDPVTGVVTFVPKEVTNNPITQNSYVLAFDVTSTFGNAVVKDANGITLPATQNLGNTKTYHINSNADGKAVVRVTSQSADTVSVNVTGASNILPTQTASVSFVNSTVVPDLYSGTVESYDYRAGTLTFAGKQKVDLYGSNILYTKGTEVIANYDAFTDLLKNATGTVSVTRTVKDGVTTFNIYNIATSGTKPVDTSIEYPGAKALTDAITAGKAVDATKFTAASVTAVNNAVLAGEAVPATATDVQKQAAANAINAAIAALELAPTALEGVVITSADALASNAAALGLGFFSSYKVEGTVADASITSVDVVLNYSDATQAAKVITVAVTDGKFTTTYDATADIANLVKSAHVKVGNKTTVAKDFAQKLAQ